MSYYGTLDKDSEVWYNEVGMGAYQEVQSNQSLTVIPRAVLGVTSERLGSDSKQTPTCQLCKNTKKRLNRHRIVPGLIYGGEYTSDNIIILCTTCHKLVHRMINLMKCSVSMNEDRFRQCIENARLILGKR